MFGKLFPQMFEGSLVDAGWEAIVTLQQLVILANVEGVIDKTPDWISRTTTIPIDIITKGLAALEKPDPESRTPDEEGRRIVRVSDARSWGWRIVNYAHYRNLRKEEERRDYHRQYWREVRSPKLKPHPEDDAEELERRTQAAGEYRAGLQQFARSKLQTQQDSTPTQQDSTDSTDAVSIGRRRCRGKSNKDLKTPASRAANVKRSPFPKSVRTSIHRFWRELGGSETYREFDKVLSPVIFDLPREFHRTQDDIEGGLTLFYDRYSDCGQTPVLSRFVRNPDFWIDGVRQRAKTYPPGLEPATIAEGVA